MQPRRYYQDGAGPVAYAPPPDEEDQDDQDIDFQPPPEQQEVQANNAMMAGNDGGSIPEGPPGNYLAGPDDYGSAPSPDSPIPGMPGRMLSDLSAPPPPAPPAAPQQPSEYQTALKALGKIYDQYPQRKAPNWMERVAAGVLGGAAGWSNAARRAAPIDIGKTTEGILYPGYDSKLAQWQSRVVPAQQAVEIAGQQAAAGWKGQQIGAETALKGAQLGYYQQRGQYYGSLNPSRMVPVTPEIEKASRGFYHVGQTIPATAAAKAYDDYVKAGKPQVLRPGEVLLGGDNKPIYTNPANTARPPAANASLLAIRATGGTTGNPQVDAMAPDAAKRAIEISKPRDPLTDVLAQAKLDDIRTQKNTALDQEKANKEAEARKSFLQELSSAENTTNRRPGYDVEQATITARKNAQTTLQNIQDNYARTVRNRGGVADDYNVTIGPDNSIGYVKRQSAPPTAAGPAPQAQPVAAPPRAPVPVSPRPAAQAAAPPPPAGPAPIRRYNAEGHGVELVKGQWVPIPQ